MDLRKAITASVLLFATSARALVGDCSGDGIVPAAEASLCADIMQGAVPLSSCPPCDADGNGSVSSDELQMALNNSLGCCADRVVCEHECVPTPTPTPTYRVFCAGDCDGRDLGVSIGELLICTGIEAGTRPVAECLNCDADGDGAVSADELACALGHFNDGCPARPGRNGDCRLPTGSPGPTRTPTPPAASTPTFTTSVPPSSTPGTATVTPSGGITQTPSTQPCVGDCNDDQGVMVNELVTGVNIALDRAALSTCVIFDGNASLHVEVNELVTGVNNLLRGCP